MSRSDEYRANAVASANLGATVDYLNTKVVLLNMAEAWLRLADYVERNQPRESRKEFGAATLQPDIATETSQKSSKSPRRGG